jgi:hypothetical protein
MMGFLAVAVTTITGCPDARPAKASLNPRLPQANSAIRAAGSNAPRAGAFSAMCMARNSFMLPTGSKPSSFAQKPRSVIPWDTETVSTAACPAKTPGRP